MQHTYIISNDEEDIVNILSSLENEHDAANQFIQARLLMSEARFNLRSWEFKLLNTYKYSKQQNVFEKRNFIVEIFGLKWDVDKETITFQKVDTGNCKRRLFQ